MKMGNKKLVFFAVISVLLIILTLSLSGCGGSKPFPYQGTLNGNWSGQLTVLNRSTPIGGTISITVDGKGVGTGDVALSSGGSSTAKLTAQVDTNGNLTGTVSFTLPGQPAAQQAGQIQLANFPNPGGLNSLGGNLYAQTDASGAPVVGAPGSSDGLGTLMQGFLEQSNVSIVQEFVNLIVSQRAYEANSKVVKAADDMYQQVNNLKQ